MMVLPLLAKQRRNFIKLQGTGGHEQTGVIQRD
jgi:hypothetical protein